MEVDSSLGNGELIGDLLVAIAVSNKSQHFQFASRQIVVTQMLGEARRHLCWYVPFARMHRPDHGQQFIFRHALQHVS